MYPILFPVVKIGIKYKRGYPFKLKERLLPKITGEYDFLIHLASLGEANTVSGVLSMWEDLFDKILVETVTDTGMKKINEKFNKIKTVFFPYDYIPVIIYILKKVKIKKIVLMETELWPGMLIAAKLLGIKIIVINGKLSLSTIKMLNSGAFFWKDILLNISNWYVISQETKSFLLSYGVSENKIKVVPDIKYLTLKNQKKDIKVNHLIKSWKKKEKLMIFGSMHQGEEQIFKEIWKINNYKFVFVPRHLNNLKELEVYFDNIGVKHGYYSDIESIDSSVKVLIVDKFGILSSLYSVCDIAVIGGSFIPIGGHNPLEPLSFGKPVVFGKYMNNFSEIADDLLESGIAKTVLTENDLVNIIENLSKIFNRNSILKSTEKLNDKIDTIVNTYSDLLKL